MNFPLYLTPLKRCFCLSSVLLVAAGSPYTALAQAAVSMIPALSARPSAAVPFTIAGPSGVLLGQQDGTFEAWVLPVKLLRDVHLTAQVAGYAVPIALNPLAAGIEVFPGHTTITYSHIAVTVRQTMFAPQDGPEGTGAMVVFTFDSVRPVTLNISFTPDMRSMWPAPSFGTPSPEWVPEAGAYVLHTDSPALTGAVAMPGALPGILAPYQERPQTHPLEFNLRYDPALDRGKTYPLVMAVGRSVAASSNVALLAKLAELRAKVRDAYAANETFYTALTGRLTKIHTPDSAFDQAFTWAGLSIEQLRARLGTETGLVAGYYSSGDSARPGFGWFFGRDALYTVPAINALGDFKLTRESLNFLLTRQRADGKMMHEYSQTAGQVDWAATPYLYAAADATPLFLLAMLDYAQTSGDTAYVRQNRAAIVKAWKFESTHDSDGDGIYDNAEGTGWVESWPGGQPHQEIYLALLDRQASTAMSELAVLLGDGALAKEAANRAAKVNATLEREYYQPATGDYGFSRSATGLIDHAATLYPALAWWASGTGLAHPNASLRRWDSHDFATDWGARDVAETDPVYDPISYHQGSVWPLFTGWMSIADYRTAHPLAGYAALRHNADQTYTQDLGAVTELLSGAYFQPFGRSTSHQLWSSAMVITPTLRGMFGITVDAARHAISVAPQLPAEWNSASVENLHVGDSVCTLEFARANGGMQVRSRTTAGPAVTLNGAGERVLLALPAVEASLYQSLPAPGARTSQAKVLGETYATDSLTLELEGLGGSSMEFLLRRNLASAQLRVDGGAVGVARADGMVPVVVMFPAGAGYVGARVVVQW